MTRLSLALALLLTAAPLAAQPSVVAVSPTANALTAARTAAVEITFDTALDPASVTTESVRVFGRWSGPAEGAITVIDGTLLRFEPDTPFFAGELVTVSLSRAVRSPDGTPMEKGYAWSFWAASAPGSMALAETGQLSTRQPGEGLVRSYGAYGGDLNGDGWSDLAIPNEVANDVRVFLNNGGGYDTFTIHDFPNASVPSTNEGGDFNGDGHIDLAVGNIGNTSVGVFMGDGEGGFASAASFPAGSSVRGLCVLDVDGDGHDDLATANRTASNVTVLRGLGDGTFEAPVAVETGTNGETACAAADANGDGVTDLFVGAINSGQIALLLGDGEGNLVPTATVSAGANPWMLAAGDVNGDGHVDVVAGAASSANVAVVLGDGAGGFGAVTTYSFGQFTVAIDLGDVDGDGDLDLASSNFSSRDFHLFENLGDGTFAAPLVFPVSGNGSCAVFHDRDNDGDLDMTGIDETDDLLTFYENPGENTGSEPPPTGGLAVSLFPNPTAEAATVRVTVATPGDVSVRVFDALGREVARREARAVGSDLDLTFPTERWSAGVYHVRVETAAGVRTRTFTLAR